MFAWLTGTETTPPAFLELRSSYWLILVTVSAAIFTDVFLYGIIVPVLPFALHGRAGIAENDVQPTISILLAAYGGSLLVGAPICGWASDRFDSRRWPFMVGLLALAGSTVFLVVGNSLALIVVGRVLQGLSAAVVWVVGLALLNDTVGSDAIGEAMGVVGIAMSMAYLLGPLLGGIVFKQSGYYAVFAMAFGLLGLDAILRLIMIEKKVAQKWLGTKAVEVSTDDEHKGSTNDDLEADPECNTPEDTETPAVTPTKRKVPTVFSLLSSYRLDAALFGCFISAALLTSFDSILPLYVNELWGWDSIGAGLVFLAVTIPSFVGPYIGKYADTHGARWLTAVGFIVTGPCFILFRLVDHDSIRQKVLLCALLAIVGLGVTLSLTPLMAEVSYAVEAQGAKRPAGFFGRNGAFGQAFGLFNMAYAAGTMVGPILAGFIKEKDGWGTATLVLGCLSLITTVPTLIWCGGSIFKLRRKQKAEQVLKHDEEHAQEAEKAEKALKEEEQEKTKRAAQDEEKKRSTNTSPDTSTSTSTSTSTRTSVVVDV
ncbi:MFS general substrate transporter [Aureobasidium pullulans]|nr:MFS general substrate transporter [Aureobasidium pullulans]